MKNIVLLITDTFRYDNLGDVAKRPVRTPELDAFAAHRASAIEDFYTGSFPTIPHRTDVATGAWAGLTIRGSRSREAAATTSPGCSPQKAMQRSSFAIARTYSTPASSTDSKPRTSTAAKRATATCCT